MEDLVAVKVIDDAGTEYYFMTWGRVFDVVDPEPLIEALTPHLSSTLGIRSFASIQLCRSLREASGQPYFFEALFEFSQKAISFGKNYETWQKKRKKAIRKGKEISYLGSE